MPQIIVVETDTRLPMNVEGKDGALFMQAPSITRTAVTEAAVAVTLTEVGTFSVGGFARGMLTIENDSGQAMTALEIAL
jgi:hypothetical protein